MRINIERNESIMIVIVAAVLLTVSLSIYRIYSSVQTDKINSIVEANALLVKDVSGGDYKCYKIIKGI